jgi:hypothetical protein
MVLVCLASGRTGAAQPAPNTYATPAHVSAVQGVATIERNGQADAVAENLPLLEGDRLRTDTGRLEILLPDGSDLALDRRATLDLLSGGIIRLLSGRLVFLVSRPREGEARYDYQVHVPAGVVRLLGTGEYRVSITSAAGAPGVEVAVVRGRALLATGDTSYAVGAGQRAKAAAGQGAIASSAFNAAAGDDFYAWADSLRAERMGSRSNAYLPAELQPYGGTFDRDGRWENVPDYGWVWYPRVAVGWRPYYEGSWAPYRWGWTWVGAGRWVWPTHHYGRWGYGARGWFWIPRAHWGPAWVSWGLATDYVSWCPLGWDDGPVFGLSFGFARGSRYHAWLGWTVVPAGIFGRGWRVPRYALQGDGLRAVEHASFAVRLTGPLVPTGPAAGRGRSPGGAAPRASGGDVPVNGFRAPQRTAPRRSPRGGRPPAAAPRGSTGRAQKAPGKGGRGR